MPGGGSMAMTLTVAINAQVNPANPGGAESAIQGLLAHLAEQASPDERFLVLSTGRYAADHSSAEAPRRRSAPPASVHAISNA